MIDCFDNSRPILLGGLGPGEDRQGCMRLRLKKHRWFPKILKTKDPLIFSIGWRRFQSLPIFAVEDHNRRIRMLKYTPEHTHCVAATWGELASIECKDSPLYHAHRCSFHVFLVEEIDLLGHTV